MTATPRRIQLTLVAAIAASILLIPGAARADSSDGFCGATDAHLGYFIEPGKICAWWPAPMRFVSSDWWVRSPGSGVVCVAIIRSPWSAGQPAQPLDDQGRPTNWNCSPLRNGNANWNVAARPWVQNGFGAVYGQAAILNFSTARIQVGNSYNNWVHF
jgi:hypothetical protein